MPIKGKQKNPHLVVKWKKGGTNFEILCHPGSAKLYREGKRSLEQTIAIEEIFKNSSKFDKVKDTDLKKAFGTTDRKACLKLILEQGTFPLSKEENAEMVAKKKAEIINYLHKYYWDATKTPPIPHPEVRLEGALDQLRIKVDPMVPVDYQLQKIVKKLPEVLPCNVKEIPEDVDVRTKYSGGRGGGDGDEVSSGRGGRGGKGKKGRR